MTTSHSRTIRIGLDGIGTVELTATRWPGDEAGPFLVLHGAAGPQSVADFCELLAKNTEGDVIAPIHPGFGGTPRPDALASVSSLARLYAGLLDELDLRNVTVFGNSIGGWVASELALLSPQRVSRLILVDATGIVVPGHPVADPEVIGLAGVVARSFHDPSRFQIDPALLPPQAQTVQAQNMVALAAYGGPSGGDASLLRRLRLIETGTLVLWGESDQIVDLAFQQAYTAAIPGARLHLLAATGHLPQLETPHHVLTVVRDFLADPAPRPDDDPVWSAEYATETELDAAPVWAALRDLYTGTKLTERSDSIEIHGPFAAGSRLSVHPQGTDLTVECEIVEFAENERFGYMSVFGGQRLLSRHTLQSTAGTAGASTTVAHYQEIAGSDAAQTGPDLGARITADTPEAMADLLDAAHVRAGSAR